MSIEETVRIVSFGEMTPFNPKGVESLLNEGHEALRGEESEVYTIWWALGHGWYGAESLPNEFVEVKKFGRLSIYLYRE